MESHLQVKLDHYTQGMVGLMNNAECLAQIKLLLMGMTQIYSITACMHGGACSPDFSRYPGFLPRSKDKLTGLAGELLLE